MSPPLPLFGERANKASAEKSARVDMQLAAARTDRCEKPVKSEPASRIPRLLELMRRDRLSPGPQRPKLMSPFGHNAAPFWTQHTPNRKYANQHEILSSERQSARNIEQRDVDHALRDCSDGVVGSERR